MSLSIIVAVIALGISVISLYFSIRVIRRTQIETAGSEAVTSVTPEEIKDINMDLSEIREELKGIKQDVGYIKEKCSPPEGEHKRSPPIDKLKEDKEGKGGPTIFRVDKV